MGTDAIRGALAAGGIEPGRVTLENALGGQILAFDGWLTANAEPIRYRSPPFGGDPVAHARAVAKQLTAPKATLARPYGGPNPEAIDRLADRVAAAVPIAKAIIDGKQAMTALAKLTGLADRAAQFHQKLGDGADAVAARYDALEQRRDSVLAKHTADLDAAEAALDRLLNP